jgi:hypothetical protein
VLWSFVKAMGMEWDMLLEDEDELPMSMPMSMLDISWDILGSCVLRCYGRLCSRTGLSESSLLGLSESGMAWYVGYLSLKRDVGFDSVETR